MIKSIRNSKHGITVADLKEVIKDWPETDENGEPHEVWICDSTGIGSQAIEIRPYNPYGSVNININGTDIVISAEY